MIQIFNVTSAAWTRLELALSYRRLVRRDDITITTTNTAMATAIITIRRIIHRLSIIGPTTNNVQLFLSDDHTLHTCR